LEKSYLEAVESEMKNEGRNHQRYNFVCIYFMRGIRPEQLPALVRQGIKEEPLMCECWLENGVQRTARSEYVCAACGADISIIYSFLSCRDDALADQLIEKGSQRAVQE
jgi:hypothetical protein